MGLMDVQSGELGKTPTMSVATAKQAFPAMSIAGPGGTANKPGKPGTVTDDPEGASPLDGDVLGGISGNERPTAQGMQPHAPGDSGSQDRTGTMNPFQSGGSDSTAGTMTPYQGSGSSPTSGSPVPPGRATKLAY